MQESAESGVRTGSVSTEPATKDTHALHGALVASSFTKPFAQRMHALSTGVKPGGHARSPVTEKEYLRGANRVR
jgi:hypothetical protein